MDVTFLRALYEDVRSVEMAGLPLPEDVRTRFLDDQFALQHRHYVTCFAAAAFNVIECDGQPIGRWYVDASGADLHVIDICLATHARGKGIGTALLTVLMLQASSEQRSVVLKVNRHNVAAGRLYERLGFVYDTEPGDSIYRAMRRVS